MSRSANPALIETTMHYRLVQALARQEQQCPQLTGAGSRLRDRLTLASIAIRMNVPVVLVTYQDQNKVTAVASHGLDGINDIVGFAAACDNLCVDREVVIPDIRAHEALGSKARGWPDERICFLVGIPLRNINGERAGSLVVINNSRDVARHGISFRKLADIARKFSQTGRLQPEPANG